MKKSGDQYTGGRINFSIVECTRGRKHNQYCYIGERVLLDKPVPVRIKIKNAEGVETEKTVTYQHKNKVNKVKKAEVKPELVVEAKAEVKPEVKVEVRAEPKPDKKVKSVKKAKVDN